MASAPSKSQAPGAQLDLFLDSQAVVAANDVAAALLARHPSQAAMRLAEAARQGYEHPAFADLAQLTRLLSGWHAAASDPVAIARALSSLEATAGAAAILGLQARDFMATFFVELAQAAASIPYDAAQPRIHSAALLLQAGKFTEAERAASSIAKWAHIPDALYWVTVARYRMHDLPAARGTLFALAWHAPERLEPLLSDLDEQILWRDWRAFETAAEWEHTADLPAWFPAWYVMEHPAAAQDVAPELTPDTPAAQAARLMIKLLELERQGNGQALAQCRARLRTLNSDLFALYMSRRTVRHI